MDAATVAERIIACRMTATTDMSATAPQTREQLLKIARARTPQLSGCGVIDAELLLAHVLNLSRTHTLLDLQTPVCTADCSKFLQLFDRRLSGEPLAYITGRREFWSLALEVNADVLIPRPETELLVERALELCQLDAAAVVDLGTGSGAIALAVASERTRWNIVAVDHSAAALAVAKRNAERITTPQIEWVSGDWFAPLHGRRFHMVLSNPPYVRDDDPALLNDGVCREPRLALCAGPDGLDALRIICSQAPHFLLPHGAIALEHGSDQGEPVRKLLVASGFDHVRSHPDLAGLERVTEAIWPG